MYEVGESRTEGDRRKQNPKFTLQERKQKSITGMESRRHRHLVHIVGPCNRMIVIWGELS